MCTQFYLKNGLSKNRKHTQKVQIYFCKLHVINTLYIIRKHPYLSKNYPQYADCH